MQRPNLLGSGNRSSCADAASRARDHGFQRSVNFLGVTGLPHTRQEQGMQTMHVVYVYTFVCVCVCLYVNVCVLRVQCFRLIEENQTHVLEVPLFSHVCTYPILI